ncbi:hypothetical protein [Lactobacillus delbrueckii]|nr:hypothetical protein [Lactobacillus delbrueckii]MCD5543705.1 hypothetical protein [Lactobacillus delbrueckii subsp. lactis]MCD5562003.1 hypothetical protein [Lactobacillus delbrueckii subsp. lactis]
MFIDSDDYILDDALNVISCYLNTDADVIFLSMKWMEKGKLVRESQMRL